MIFEPHERLQKAAHTLSQLCLMAWAVLGRSGGLPTSPGLFVPLSTGASQGRVSAKEFNTAVDVYN